MVAGVPRVNTFKQNIIKDNYSMSRSIIKMSKAKIKDMDKFRDALRKADFSSTRGKCSFDKNHHPIQDIYVREVIKEGKTLTNKIVSVGLRNHSNVYVSECNM